MTIDRLKSDGDHGALTGLGDDDHPQYLNETRGDARYYTEAEVDALIAASAQAASGSYTGNGVNGRTIALPFTPKLVVVSRDAASGIGARFGISRVTSVNAYGFASTSVDKAVPVHDTTDAVYRIVPTTDGFIVYSSGAGNGFNDSGFTFYYTAIG